MKILVTGGAGFIGSNVVDTYVAEGHEVVIIDNLSSGKRENINPGAKFYEVDIRSDELPDIIREEAPDIINHHAAQMSVPASVEDPINDADINVKGFLNILETIKNGPTKKVIFISSGGAIYGEATEYPTSEKYDPKPLSPYAITKFISEKYLAYYQHLYGLDFTVLRYANVYGPRQIPHAEAGVVAIFTDNLLSGKPSIIYGFPGAEEGMLRDYTFVGDIARANLLALGDVGSDAFNIGTNVGTCTRELYDTIYGAIKAKRPELATELKDPAKGGVREGDVKRSCLNVDKAQEGLGWSHKVSLAEGIAKTVEWRLSVK